MNWKGIDIIYCGKIDRIMKNRVDGHLYNFETKSTTQGLSNFINQIRPNHQLTGYHVAAKELGLDLAGSVWDATFISKRKPDPDSKDQWLRTGIDIKNDFARADSRRSVVDMEEWWFDIESIVTRYMLRKESGLRRWERNAPFMCHAYGGCQYRRLCANNLNPAIIKSDYVVKHWEPWKEDEELKTNV